MEYIPVSSSNVAAVAYNAPTNTLGVRFLNGSEYHYFGVPEEIFEALKSATSVGTYLNAAVKKGGYSYQRVG
jgi:hypothetical protein